MKEVDVGNQSNSFSLNTNGEIDSDFWTDYNHEYSLKDFERRFSDFFDKRFVLIWMVTFIVHVSTALYFTINPPRVGSQQEQIDRIQKQYATFVLEKEIEPQPVEPEPFLAGKIFSEKGSISSEAKRNAGAVSEGGFQSRRSEETGVAWSDEADGTVDYTGGDKRRSSREQISREVSSKGLLGLLTGSGSNAKGEAITDVLGEAGATQGDLEKALGELDGLKRSGKAGTGGIITQGKGKAGQKGTRSTEGAGIDELIAGKGQATSTDVQRKGNIVVEQVSAIADERGIRSESRDADQVSEVINRHNSSIQYCYQRELKQNPDLKGKLVVRFTVTPEGKVNDVKVISSTLDSPSIERCVISRIKRWDDFGAIDPSKGEATFRQVYTFGY
jgi:TonB family protein